MEGLLHFGLANAAWAAVLALVAAVGSRIFSRYPAVVHALWLMVLLKLATPSLVQIPVRWTEGQPREIVVKSESIERRPSVAPLPNVPEVPRKPPSELRIDAPLQTRSAPILATARPWPWRQSVVALWLAGMAVWWVVVGLGITRFRRLLRASRPAPAALNQRLAQIAARLGLEGVPPVSIVAARVPPMVWSSIAGRPRIVLPEELWSRFDPEQQDAVLAHELAHLKRRDHWVRRLEAVVLGLYWWNPVAWWARRAVERAEEDCCDAWVVWALPAAAGAYVEALADTAVYLAGLRLPLPVGASGAGRVRTLTRRLNMILSDRSTGSLGRRVPTGVLVAGMFVLAILPIMAGGQSPATDPTPAPEQKTAPGSTQPEKADKSVSDPAKVSRKVRVIQPQAREVSDTLVVSGTLESVEHVELKARVSGRIEAVHCRRGHMVKKGELLFEIDRRQYEAERNKAQAEVRLVQSRIKGLQSKLREVQTQVEQHLVGPSAQWGVEGDLEAAEANLQSAKADLDLAVLKCESTRVTSPINGTINRSIAAGNVAVADTTELAEILSFHPMCASIAIERDVHQTIMRLIREGKIEGDFTSGYPVKISIEGEDSFKRNAKADLAAATFRPGNQVTWRVFISNPDGSLMRGLNVQVLLVTSAPYQGLVLPARAVRFPRPGSTNPDSTLLVILYGAAQFWVMQASRQSDGMVAIPKVLKADQWVVENFDPQLDGRRVETEKVTFPK